MKSDATTISDPLLADPADYDDVDIDDPDNPELTAEEIAGLRPAREVLGDAFVDAWTAARREGTLATHAVPDVQLRLSVEVIDFYRAQGSEWEARLNADLEDLVRIKRRG